ncbi:VOC family protein [Roseivivax sp. CAU 1753]
MLRLDHIAVLGTTLKDAADHCAAAFGAPLGPGGQHAVFATHNRLLGLADGLYVEAIAIDPDAPKPDRARWFGLDAFSGPPRLARWIARVPDMAQALAVLPEAGAPVALQRGGLSWVMAVPASGLTPFDGLFPALIEWKNPKPAGDLLPSSGWSLQTLTIWHPEATRLSDRLAPHLDAPRVRFEDGPCGLRATLTGQGREICLR